MIRDETALRLAADLISVLEGDQALVGYVATYIQNTVKHDEEQVALAKVLADALIEHSKERAES